MEREENHPLLVLAAGGTGGHVFPAQAVAEEMLNRGWHVHLWTDQRGLKFSQSFPRAVKVRKIISGTFFRGSVVARFTTLFHVAIGIAISWLKLQKLRPAVVVGFGGYPAFPPLFAACVLNLPRLIHEQNGILGKANRILSTRVNLVVCGAVETELPAGVKSVLAGNPVRSEVISVANSPYKWPRQGLVNVLIFGGSQGAEIMDRLVPAAIGQLPFSIRCRLQIVQQVRRSDLKRVQQIYQDLGVASHVVDDFFSDLPQRMANAHLVIARAGASSVAEIGIIGRPAILIPFAAAANDHQAANARGLVNARAAVTIEEGDFTAEYLMEEMMRFFEKPSIADHMAKAANEVAMPRAAAKFADIVEDLVEADRQ